MVEFLLFCKQLIRWPILLDISLQNLPNANFPIVADLLHRNPSCWINLIPSTHGFHLHWRMLITHCGSSIRESSTITSNFYRPAEYRSSVIRPFSCSSTSSLLQVSEIIDNFYFLECNILTTAWTSYASVHFMLNDLHFLTFLTAKWIRLIYYVQNSRLTQHLVCI